MTEWQISCLNLICFCYGFCSIQILRPKKHFNQNSLQQRNKHNLFNLIVRLCMKLQMPQILNLRVIDLEFFRGGFSMLSVSSTECFLQYDWNMTTVNKTQYMVMFGVQVCTQGKNGSVIDVTCRFSNKFCWEKSSGITKKRPLQTTYSFRFRFRILNHQIAHCIRTRKIRRVPTAHPRRQYITLPLYTYIYIYIGRSLQKFR